MANWDISVALFRSRPRNWDFYLRGFLLSDTMLALSKPEYGISTEVGLSPRDWN